MYNFTEDCLIGVEEIDEEHRVLFQLMNEIFNELNNMNTGDAVNPELRNKILTLSKSSEDHFKHEEDYMESIRDTELLRQKKEHEIFQKQINDYLAETELAENPKAHLEELMLFLVRWLYHHILGSDIMIGKILADRDKETDPFEFTPKYWTGIKFVDEEHKRLFEIIRETFNLINTENLHDKYDEILNILDELKEYTEMHFDHEETYMGEIAYVKIPEHKEMHAAFIEKINEINLEEVDENQQEYLFSLIDFLLGWLDQHIMKEDKQIPVMESAK